MFKKMKCGSLLLTTGLLAYVHRNQLKSVYDNAMGMLTKAKTSICPKPQIVLMYDSSPCTCESVACDGQPSHENETPPANEQTPCCCGCDLDAYKNLFGKFSDKANAVYIDTKTVCPADDAKCNSYINRFELEYIPSILILTPNENLIAKIEAPEKLEDVANMLNLYLH